MTSSFYQKQKYKTKLKGLQDGFTMIEIMVALTLVALIFALIPSDNSNAQIDDLQKAIENIKRSVRFAENESILSGRVTRIKFELSKDPQTFVVQIAGDADFILQEERNIEKMSISEKEAYLKSVEDQNSQFNTVSEYEDFPGEIPHMIKIEAYASNLTKELKFIDTVYYYVYPNGIKDEGFFILSNDYQIVSLALPAVESRFYEDYHNYTDYELGQIDRSIEQWTKDYFEAWQKGE